MNQVGWEITSPFPRDMFTDVDNAHRELGDAPAGSALIVVKHGPNAGARFALDRRALAAGRHLNSDIYLDDVTVSRKHAEFRSADGEFRLVDVGSLNGTYLNRKPVQSAVLSNGDEIQIGNFRLMFLIG